MTLITASVAQWHDFEWLKSRMPKDATFKLTDRTEEYSTQILAGPNSRKILAEVCAADLALPWLTHQETRSPATG